MLKKYILLILRLNYTWPKNKNADEVEFALFRNHPLGEFKNFNNPKCIASLFGNAESILRDPELPSSVQATRVVDPSIQQLMSEYVILSILNHWYKIDSIAIKIKIIEISL